MLDQFYLQIYSYTNFIILCIAVTFVIFIILKLSCRKFSFLSKNIYLMSMFYNMKKMHILYLDCLVVRYIFVLSVIIFSMQVDITSLIFLVLLSIIANLAFFDMKELLIDCINYTFITFALIFIDFFRIYMSQVVIEAWMVGLCLLAILFVITYVSYFLLRSIKKYLVRSYRSYT